jgi:hypothetical protein
MSDPLSHTTLQLTDYAEQGDHPYVVFTPTRDAVAIAIDGWTVDENAFIGYIRAEPAIVLPADSGWVVYSSKLVRRLTRAESIQIGLAQTKREYEIKREFLDGLKADEAAGIAEDDPSVLVVGAADERRGYL